MENFIYVTIIFAITSVVTFCIIKMLPESEQPGRTGCCIMVSVILSVLMTPIMFAGDSFASEIQEGFFAQAVDSTKVEFLHIAILFVFFIGLGFIGFIVALCDGEITNKWQCIFRAIGLCIVITMAAIAITTTASSIQDYCSEQPEATLEPTQEIERIHFEKE